MSASRTSRKEIAALLRRVSAALEMGDFSECTEISAEDALDLIEDCDATAAALYDEDEDEDDDEIFTEEDGLPRESTDERRREDS